MRVGSRVRVWARPGVRACAPQQSFALGHPADPARLASRCFGTARAGAAAAAAAAAAGAAAAAAVVSSAVSGGKRAPEVPLGAPVDVPLGVSEVPLAVPLGLPATPAAAATSAYALSKASPSYLTPLVA